LAKPSAHEAQRWMPPDVGAPLPRPPASVAAPDPIVQPPTADEIAAIEEAARTAGAESGYQAGYQSGYQEGLDQALQQAEEERLGRLAREAELHASQEATLRETVAALEGIARSLADPLASSADELEPELLMLVATLAKRVIMEELSLRPELITRVLRQALVQLPSRNHPLRVHVHPDDQAILDDYANSVGESIAWFADPAIERGGCLVDSGASRIDARLETRLRQSIDAVWGELAPPVVCAAVELVATAPESESVNNDPPAPETLAPALLEPEPPDADPQGVTSLHEAPPETAPLEQDR
jgi:flagellar assembly protein FliH